MWPCLQTVCVLRCLSNYLHQHLQIAVSVIIDIPALCTIIPFLTITTIPLTWSIANGLSFGLTSYALIQLLTGRAKKKDWMLYLLSALFLLRFIYLAKS